jgi:hypothetical protein
LGFITVVIKPAFSVRCQKPIKQENRTRTASRIWENTLVATATNDHDTAKDHAKEHGKNMQQIREHLQSRALSMRIGLRALRQINA